MNKRSFRIVPLMFAALIAMGGIAWGYNGPTHKLINDVIYDNSVVNQYFKGLGFVLDGDGRIAQELLPGSTPYKLFKQAGEDEDGPGPFHFRACNHFHDPTRNWELAGFTNPILPNGMSSILWAQYPLLQTPPQSLVWGPNTVWNWQRGYDYFLAGLTGATPDVRNANLAWLFTNLGRMTHLTADVSVPEHTRNDFHVWSIENWCEANIKSPTSPIFGTPQSRADLAPDDHIFAQSQSSAFSTPPLALLSPISNLWDSFPGRPDGDQEYTEAFWAAPKLVGLANYSNYNYFSDDTVFSGYDYPSRSVPYVSDITGIVIPSGGKQTWSGVTETIAYYVWFTRDEDGIWRIEKF